MKAGVSSQQLRNYWAIERLSLGNRQFAYSKIAVEIQSGQLATGVLSAGFSLLIPVSASEEFAESRDLRVSLRKSEVAWGGETTTYLEIVCHDETLELAFAQLCSDLVEVVISSDQPGVDARIHYDRWRALFANQKRVGLGKNEVVGLLGELFTLADLVLRRVDRSISIWTGPAKAAHDFQSGRHHLEVKSTTSQNGVIVGIHGLSQLDVGEDEDLHLVVHQMTQSDTGVSIGDQIEVLVGYGVDRVALYDKLSQAGFDWADSSNFQNLRFKREATYWYAVDSDFPKIIPASFAAGHVPAGVVNVQYSVDLTGPLPAHLDDQKVLGVTQLFEVN